MHDARHRSARRRLAGLAAGLGALAAAAPALGVATAPAGTTQLVTRPTGSAVVGPSAASTSILTGARVVSADGRYVVFVSSADGLVPGGAGGNAYGAFVKDMQTGEVTLASRADGPGGGPVEVYPAGVSLAVAGGAVRVAFVTAAAIDPADVNGVQDVYVRNATTGTTVLASRASGVAGTPGNGGSLFPALSADGTRVSFASTSTNLHPSDADAVPDVHLRDLVTGTTLLVSRASLVAGGAKGDGASLLSLPDADGSHVAFTSTSTNLSGADANGRLDMYLRDVAGATTVLVSRADGAAGAVGDGAVEGLPSISDDGRYVAFATDSNNLNPAQPTGTAYRRDTVANTTVLIDRADGAAGAAGNANASSVSISADGQRAAFTTDASNLVPIDSNDVDDVFVRDLAAATTVLASRAAGPAGALGTRPSPIVALSGDGGTAFFVSGSPELVPGAPTDVPNVFARVLATATTTLASRPAGSDPYTTGGLGDVGGGSFALLSGDLAASVSADGRVVAFVSVADGLSTEDDDRVANVYARDTLTGVTTLVSRATGPAGGAGDGDSDEPVVSADGTKVAFTSLATNLAPGVPAGREQVYVRDLAAQTTTLVSRADGPDGNPGASYSRDPSISGDGNRVAFETSGAFDPADGPGNDVYVRDVAAGTTTYVSRASGASGAGASSLSSDPSISQDGRRVAFVSRATNLDPDDPLDGSDVFVRDLVALTTVVASRANGAAGLVANGSVFSPSIDADGSRVAFLTSKPLEPAVTGQHVFVRDLDARTTTLASRADGPAGVAPDGFMLEPALSGSGDVVAFSTQATGLHPDDADTLRDVYVRDLAAATTSLASRATGGQKGNGDSARLALSANGSCLLIVTRSSNLDPTGYVGTTGDFQLGYLRTLSGECPASAPETAIAGGPTVRTNDPTPTFSFTADEPATFACRLDGADFVSCGATSELVALAPGPHVLDVRAIDAAGNVDATPATREFVVNAAPDSAITPPGKRHAEGTLRRLRGTASDDAGVVRVELAVVRLVAGARVVAAKGRPRPACYGLTAKGRLKRLRLAKGVCKPIFLRARGTIAWSRSLPRSLPPGAYVVLSRAVDADGVAETSFSAQDGNRRTFAIRSR